MIIRSTGEMKELEDLIEPYINWDDPIHNRFPEGTPPEILEAQDRLEKLAREEALYYMFG